MGVRNVGSLCVLTASEYAWSANVERIMKALHFYDFSPCVHGDDGCQFKAEGTCKHASYLT